MILFFLVFVAISKASFGDVICDGNPFETCPRPKLFTMVPVSKAEYEDLCPYLSEYIRCLGRFQENCTTHFFATAEEHTSVVTAFAEFCEEGSLLNLIVTENLECLNKSLGSEICRVQASGAATVFEELTTIVFETEAEIPYIGSLCIQESLHVACIADEIAKNCGNLVKDAALEMIQRSYVIHEACSLEDIINILDNQSLMSLTPSFQPILENVLKQME